MNMYKPEESENQLQGVASELGKLGARTLCAVTDMRKSADVEALAEKALKAFGKVDILVNNVGGTFSVPFLELSEGGWDAVIRENLKTTFLGCHVVGAHMAQQRSGAIVNIASIDGRGPAPHRAHYGAAKAGVISLTQTLAAELAPSGVRVNAIAPHFVKTAGLAHLLAQDPEKEKRAIASMPLGRLGAPEDVAALALFLASDAASFITGETINLTGGVPVPAGPEMF
jgi:NAD(P)-dependent dehydrogenase (short-subunit alcohol dehydrogenase family)